MSRSRRIRGGKALESYNKTMEKNADIKAQYNSLADSDKAIVDGFYAQCKRLNAIFKSPKRMPTFHIDHIVPYANGGRHEPSNLMLVPAKLNCAKGNRHNEPIEFTI